MLIGPHQGQRPIQGLHQQAEDTSAPTNIAQASQKVLATREPSRQALSGGERNRLALAVALARPANLLVLDEPTNDLDMDSLDALEDMLAAYDGTVILVSHDRAFLDGVATQIVAPLGKGRWVESPGGWADFERAYPTSMAPTRSSNQPAPTATPSTREPARATKLSFKHERRSAELDALLPALQNEIAALEQHLSDPSTFANDRKNFETLAARLAKARNERDAAELEWLEIEMLREQLAARS